MKKTKPWHRMSVADLAKATKEYDREFVADLESRPLSRSDRAKHQAAKKHANAAGKRRHRPS